MLSICSVINIASDFGARDRDVLPRGEESHHRSRSTFVGTAQYVSPEVLVDGDVGPSCVFSLLFVSQTQFA